MLPLYRFTDDSKPQHTFNLERVTQLTNTTGLSGSNLQIHFVGLERAVNIQFDTEEERVAAYLSVEKAWLKVLRGECRE